MSKLARQGSAVLQQIVSTSQAMAVKVQGQGAMVTLSQRQYDEMVELIHAIQLEKFSDGFTESLSQQFDELMARMNQPDADKATQAALFGTPAALNKAYRPGATESKT
ncbi:hypothetical protein [sulfur-oxidizing endosymbiont of Gigantopelta aegis]|uniref:hypothetical protein n=1 Tax=sulfur-oxidizing endosymbiont of Gigantopelta aegis TaxID=2794934 RepID=UPI0018DB1653|nr:hypothetical protein [sulfur-oxidizing endosymbiont of Gigantopelta aegis]